MEQRRQLKINLPADVSDFVSGEAQKNGASQNSEIVRALRERMDRITVTKAAPEPGLDNQL